ncbi:MAG: sensor histidine kinase [Lachnospiraceae bacterium]
MKKPSIRLKITLWFTLALAVAVLFAYLAVLSASREIIRKSIRDNLIETVEYNVDEIEFYSLPDEFEINNYTDYYIEYNGGYLEVDDDFLGKVNGVYTALYKADGTLIYGENPIHDVTKEMKFADSKLHSCESGKAGYFVYDRKLTARGLEGLWLRGVISEEQGKLQMTAIIRIALIFLPILLLITSVGGYFITRRMLLPIRDIARTANQIRDEGDLKARIDIGQGDDELHQLADSFNAMFERLDHSFEAERRFTSDASHELRTPLSVILAQCELVLDQPKSIEEYQEALQVIWRQSSKMSHLTAEMMDFVRLETGAERYIKAELNLSELVSQVCSDMALIREKGINLTWSVQEHLYFYGNQELLTRLLSNLINNAYRYGRENGHIAVTLAANEKELLLSVKDDGIGIDEAEQEKIFRRLYRVDPSRSEEGTGLGLFMAQEICRIHGGRITVRSKAGEGSCFTIHFPN